MNYLTMNIAYFMTNLYYFDVFSGSSVIDDMTGLATGTMYSGGIAGIL
jgi:hypothetical protein